MFLRKKREIKSKQVRVIEQLTEKGKPYYEVQVRDAENKSWYYEEQAETLEIAKEIADRQISPKVLYVV